MGKELYTLVGAEFEHETDAAICVRIPGEETIWLPLSQIESIEWSKDRKIVNVTMSAWIAKQKHLI